MPQELIIFLIVLCLFFLFNSWRLVNKKRILLKHAIFWSFLTIAVMIATLTTKYLKIVSDFVGIQEVSNMIFLFGFLVLLVISFSLTTTVSKQKMSIVKLTQELALTNKRIEELKHEKSTKKV